MPKVSKPRSDWMNKMEVDDYADKFYGYQGGEDKGEKTDYKKETDKKLEELKQKLNNKETTESEKKEIRDFLKMIDKIRKEDQQKIEDQKGRGTRIKEVIS